MPADLVSSKLVAEPKVPACPVCGTRMERHKKRFLDEDIAVWVLMCNCMADKAAREAIEHQYSLANIPKKFYGESLSDWIETPGTADLHQITLDYIACIEKNVRAGNGALLAGPIGTGKTKHAACIQNEAIKQGIMTYYISSGELNTMIPKLRKSPKEFDDFMHRLLNIQLLVYDDIGETDPNKWDLKDANLVINERYNNKRSIIYTSMKSVRELAEQMGEHVVSRMIEMSGPFIAEVGNGAPDMRMPENRKKYGMKVLF